MPQQVKLCARPGGSTSWWLLTLILSVAFALRIISLKWAEANTYGSQGDSMEACEVAVNYLTGDERAKYIGQPNFNAHSKLPGPLWTMFCAAGLKLTGTANGIVLLTIIGNVAAIALTWWLTLEWFGGTAALIGASCMAVSPWPVHYSAVVFNPSLMPLFGALIFISAAHCLRHEKSPAIALPPFLILVGLQFHMSLLALILPLVLLAWVSRMKTNWAWFCVGLLAAALCYLPYAQGEIAHHWQNTHGMFSGGGKRFSSSALKVFSSPLSFLVNYWSPGWAYAPGEYATLARRTFGSLGGLYLVNFISGLLVVASAVGVWKIAAEASRGFWTAPRDAFSRSPGLFICVGTLSIFLLQNLAGGKPFHARYCLVVLPLLFALFGAGLAHCLEMPRAGRLVLPLGAVSLVSSLWFVIGLCRFEQDRINKGPLFVPGFTRLETIYRQLQAHPHVTGRFQVRDDDYINSLPADDKLLHNALLIRHYVDLREQATHSPATNSKKVTVFVLRAAGAMDATNPDVAFTGSGIALVAKP